MTEICSLAKLKPGSQAKISRILSTGPHTQRIMEMGLTEGVAIELAYEAPFGGAIAVRCRGSLIALRLEDAMYIEVTTS